MGKTLEEPRADRTESTSRRRSEVQVRPRSYRLPPGREDEYLILRRGEVEFCLRSTETSGVGRLGQLRSLSRGGGGSADDTGIDVQGVKLLDVAKALKPKAIKSGADIMRVKLYAAIGRNRGVYLAADELMSLRSKGVEMVGESGAFLLSGKSWLQEGRPPRRWVRLADETLPLINAELAEILAQESDNILFWDISGEAGADSRQTGKARCFITQTVATPERWADDILERVRFPKDVRQKKTFLYDMCVVGGLGHVGLPLGICFAEAGKKVVLYDVNREAAEAVSKGKMPFKEAGAEQVLVEVLGRKLSISADRNVIADSYFVVVVIGTPVDEHLNPQFSAFRRFMDEIIDLLNDDQHLILRSTVYPGTTEKIKDYLESQGKMTRVSFCPERIVQGQALEELRSMPQIVASFDDKSVKEVTELFELLTEDVVSLRPIEAELGKLFCNVWRYTQFAISNQFYQIATEHEVDFYRVYRALTAKYPRLAGLSRPGFAAGPCLFKDTMQLAAFSNNSFFLGHAAMLINEGLPNFVIQKLKDKYPLEDLTVGILGMAFKADNDDKRESLSYKLKKMLEIEAKEVLCSDVYIQEAGFVAVEELVERSDVIILGAPHRQYAKLEISEDKILVDVWNFYGKGGLF